MSESINEMRKGSPTDEAPNQQFLPAQPLYQHHAHYGKQEVDGERYGDQPDGLFGRKAGHLEDGAAVITA